MVIPRGPGDICARDGSGGAWRATWLDRSLIGIAASDERDLLDNRRSMVWSGSFAESRGGGLFDEDPRTWGRAGWTELESACHRLSITNAQVLVRPHFRHVISDVPSCRRLLESEWARALGIGLAFDPAAMCAPSMLGPGRIEDHLRRMYEAIEMLPRCEDGDLAGIATVIIGIPGTDGVPTRAADNESLGSFVLDLAKSHIPPGLPTLVPA
ncbi:MAG TPA: hypothetical protein PKE29_05580 [Phycisphaerales bacterium]|nr:hypothetical protein [Phycisphaerales bacterium]